MICSFSDAVAKPDAVSYLLKDLRPFSNYSIKLRAFNLENKPSEDTDEMYQRTLSSSMLSNFYLKVFVVIFKLPNDLVGKSLMYI